MIFWVMVALIWAFMGALVIGAFGGIGAFLFVVGSLACAVMVQEA